MDLRTRISQGLQGGLLAGAGVAAWFLVADLIRLEPLATPLALQQTFVQSSVFRALAEDPPMARTLIRETVSALDFATFAVLHLLAFALLGIGAGLALAGRSLGACVVGGTLYGTVACTLTFYLSLSLTGLEPAPGTPGLLMVLATNLLAGLVMGLYVGLGRRQI